MMTLSNSIYAHLGKRGLHNWGFLSSKAEFDFEMEALGMSMLDVEQETAQESLES